MSALERSKTTVPARPKASNFLARPRSNKIAAPAGGPTRATNARTWAKPRPGHEPDLAHEGHGRAAFPDVLARALPPALLRALARVYALHAYVDTVTFFLHRALRPAERLHLNAAGFDTSGEGGKYLTPKHQRYGRRLLRVQRPTDAQFVTFEEMEVPHHCCWVDPALDLLMRHEHEAVEAHYALAPYWIQPDHRGHQSNAVYWRDEDRRPEHFNVPSFYFHRSPKVGRNGIIYPLRFGKGTDGPKLHCEPRMRNKSACESWSLFDVRDVREADLFTMLGEELELQFVRDSDAFDRHALDHFQQSGRSELGRLLERDRHETRTFDFDYPPQTLHDVKRHRANAVLHDIHHHALVRQFDLGPVEHLHDIPSIIVQERLTKHTLRFVRRISVLELFLHLPFTLGNSPDSDSTHTLIKWGIGMDPC